MLVTRCLAITVICLPTRFCRPTKMVKQATLPSVPTRMPLSR